jgi:hypothetical protein
MMANPPVFCPTCGGILSAAQAAEVEMSRERNKPAGGAERFKARHVDDALAGLAVARSFFVIFIHPDQDGQVSLVADGDRCHMLGQLRVAAAVLEAELADLSRASQTKMRTDGL